MQTHIQTEELAKNGHNSKLIVVYKYKMKPGMGQPRISALRQIVPFLNQLCGLIRMYWATVGSGNKASTGVSRSKFPANTYTNTLYKDKG